MVKPEEKKDFSVLIRSLKRKEHRYLGVGFIQPLEAGEWLEKTVFQRFPLEFIEKETSDSDGYMAYEAWFAGPEFKIVALVGVYSNEKVGTNISITVWASSEETADRISGEMARALRPVLVFKPPVIEVKKPPEDEVGKRPTTEEIIEELELEEDTSDPTTVKLKQLQKKWITGVAGKDGEAMVFEIEDEKGDKDKKDKEHETKKKRKKVKKKKK